MDVKVYSKTQYEKSFDMLVKYERIVVRPTINDTKALDELVALCDTNEKYSLLDELLSRFYYMDDYDYHLKISQIADHIVKLKYDPTKTVVMAMAHDHESDGSQDVLNALQVALIIKGFEGFATDSRMDKPIKNHYNKGIRNFIVVDDFLGTGVTALKRYYALSNELKNKDVHISFCIVTGMKDGVNYCHRNRMPLYCPKQLDKGLSGVYTGFELSVRIYIMKVLEMSLAERIGEHKLKDYSLGWGHAESLFYREGRNVPNNVFPIFWWKKYKNGRQRATLFHRKQNGY